MPVGTYTVDILEIDIATAKVAKTTVTFEVEAIEVVFDPTAFQTSSDPDEDPDEDADEEAAEDGEAEDEQDGENLDGEAGSESGSETGEDEATSKEGDKDEEEGQAEPEEELDEEAIAEAEAEQLAEEVAKAEEEMQSSIVVLGNGKVVYPWQISSSSSKKKREQQKIEIIEEEPDPLEARIESISPTGLLTVAFTKEIIIPPLKVDKVELESTKNSTAQERDLEAQNLFPI